jgi:hypothetical protein
MSNLAYQPIDTAQDKELDNHVKPHIYDGWLYEYYNLYHVVAIIPVDKWYTFDHYSVGWMMRPYGYVIYNEVMKRRITL